MKTVLFLFALISFVTFSLQTSTSTWHDSELMNVVNQRLSTYSVQSHPQTSQAARSTSHNTHGYPRSSHVAGLVPQVSSGQHSPGGSISPRIRRERTVKSILEKSEPIQHSTHGGSVTQMTVKGEHLAESATPNKGGRKRKSVLLGPEADQVPRNRHMTEERRLETKQRMLESWAPGGSRRIAFEKSREERKQKGMTSPSVGAERKSATSKHYKSAVKIEPKND